MSRKSVRRQPSPPRATEDRFIQCQQRMQLIADVLVGFSLASKDIQLDTESLYALGELAREQADEIEHLQQVWTDENPGGAR